MLSLGSESTGPARKGWPLSRCLATVDFDKQKEGPHQDHEEDQNDDHIAILHAATGFSSSARA
jgi:hypothetical protein